MALQELSAQPVPAVKVNVQRIRLKLADESYALAMLEHPDRQVMDNIRDAMCSVNKAIDRLAFALMKVDD
jgi:hypothetical protein